MEFTKAKRPKFVRCMCGYVCLWCVCVSCLVCVCVCVYVFVCVWCDGVYEGETTQVCSGRVCVCVFVVCVCMASADFLWADDVRVTLA